jgi:hypothetical protein
MKDSVIFTVSRHAPLRVAVAQFEQLLRNLQGETKERSASKLNYGEWADCGLLPFVDLEIWRLIDGLPKFGTDIEEIPNPVLTKRILSPALAMDHTVKHVTRLWFERLFVEKSDTFLLLQTRAAANRWLGSNKAPHRRQKQQTGVHVKHKS